MATESIAPRAHGSACSRGKNFYSCVGNHFSGCCSVDPCDLLGCPDDVSVSVENRDPDEEKASGDKEPESIVQDSSTTSTSPTSKTKTDSGVTHTLPGSIVTVTRHTVVFSEVPSSTASSPFASGSAVPPPPGTNDGPIASTAAGSPADATSLTDSTGGDSSGGISLGGIVGTVAGGLVFGAVLVIVVIAWRRRRRDQAEAESESAHYQDSLGGGGGVGDGEKEHEQPMSTHTTGTQASGDPFAPFGGRFDRDPYRPPSGAFEMDGTDMAPVELPAESAMPPSRGAREAAQSYRPYMPLETPATDPRANLTSIKTESGRAGYVNHWDQWKALGDKSPIEPVLEGRGDD